MLTILLGLKPYNTAEEEFVIKFEDEPLPLEPPTEETLLVKRERTLGELALALEELDGARKQVVDLAAEARQLGVSWKELGRVAGIAPQTAYKRWSSKGREKNREYQRRWRAAQGS